MVIEWSAENAEHMWNRHQLTTTDADEAATDPNAVYLSPDPASRSGQTDRVVGYSHTLAAVLVLIVLPDGDVLRGINGWKANPTNQRIYREAQSHE